MAEQELFGAKPDVAIFADTGWEPDTVYSNIKWLATQLSYPVITVTADNNRSLREDVLQGVNARGKPWLSIPVWLANVDGTPAGMNWRQCTTDYKIMPIRAEVRRILGLKPRSPIPPTTDVEMWLGITTDELTRMRTSPDIWIVNRYPLVDAQLSREDCIEWFNQRYPERHLPRSACISCPYRSREGWIKMRDEDPKSFADAVHTDTELRSSSHNASQMFRHEAFLHPRRIPLAEAVSADAAIATAHVTLRDTATAREDNATGSTTQGDAAIATQGDIGADKDSWGNECTGICGV